MHSSISIDRAAANALCRNNSFYALCFDGRSAETCSVPQFTITTARDCALGGNPHFDGNEFLAATFADFGLWSRALSTEELRQIAKE